MTVSSVIKVGGSLYDLPDLPARLASYFSDFARPFPVAVCGGGPFVDVVRRLDRLHRLDEETAHWIALEGLSVAASFLCALAPQLEHARTPAAFPRSWEARRVPLYDAHAFIRDIDETASRALALPRRWRVTSDSIAARMASHFGGAELVLLKSLAPPQGTTIADAARAGWVDPHFPTAACELERIVVVNLRLPEPEEVLLEV